MLQFQGLLFGLGFSLGSSGAWQLRHLAIAGSDWALCFLHNEWQGVILMIIAQLSKKQMDDFETRKSFL